MNKRQLVERVAQRTSFSLKKTEEVLNALLSSISEALAEGETLRLAGFGTFKVVERKGRRVRNPKTGEIVEVPPRRCVKFVPGKRLRELV